MKQFLPGILLVCLLGYQLSAQSLPDSTTKKIDSIFSRFSKGNSPGCAVGIVRNDSIIFAKGYGLANLEYDIPNQPATIYHMASVSKQFTGYAIVLLVRQGKLKQWHVFLQLHEFVGKDDIHQGVFPINRKCKPDLRKWGNGKSV